MKDPFETNAEKASAKITINAFMIGSLFFILTLVWTINPTQFSPIVMMQLVLAIPLLFVSSLAYAKIGHWKETYLWEQLGWFTNNVGNIFVLNVVGLMTAMHYPMLAALYFILTLVLMFAYSLINIIYRPATLGEKIFKFLFFAAVMLLGGLLPLLLQ